MMKLLENVRLARMSNGRRCLIRDLGLVKGGKGLRCHEVVLELSWQGLVRLITTKMRASRIDQAETSVSYIPSLRPVSKPLRK